MDSITLCYHDIVDGNDMNASGFSGAAAATYKLTEVHFRGHIEAIARTANRGSNDLNTKSKYHVRLTFDDGGASSCRIADILECYGLRGYFFIPTDYIGRSSFISVRQIVDLQRRGHIIGSHSCSHHGRMSHMPKERLMQEWADHLERIAKMERLCDHMTFKSPMDMELGPDGCLYIIEFGTAWGNNLDSQLVRLEHTGPQS